MSDQRQAPPRLRQTLGPAGDCVREVLAEPDLVRPLPRFARLQERRSQRVRQQRALSLIVVAAAALFAARVLQQEEPHSGIRAELTASPNHQPRAVGSSALPSQPPVKRESSAPTPAKPESPTAVALKPARASAEPLARPDQPNHAPDDAPAQPPRPEEVSGSAKACAQLARGGAAEQALGCYQQLANGTGMTAELALFEQARLEGKVLRRPERALLTLDDYRRRFPNGSLRAEVMLAQIDWLLAAGDSVRALGLVDEALASGLLRERTAELERLRTTLQAAPAPTP